MRIALQNFTGGEVAPTLSARYDLARYRNSAACMGKHASRACTAT